MLLLSCLCFSLLHTDDGSGFTSLTKSFLKVKISFRAVLAVNALFVRALNLHLASFHFSVGRLCGTVIFFSVSRWANSKRVNPPRMCLSQPRQLCLIVRLGVQSLAPPVHMLDFANDLSDYTQVWLSCWWRRRKHSWSPVPVWMELVE